MLHTVSRYWTLTFDADVLDAGGDDRNDTAIANGTDWLTTGSAYTVVGGAVVDTGLQTPGTANPNPPIYRFRGDLKYLDEGLVPPSDCPAVTTVPD